MRVRLEVVDDWLTDDTATKPQVADVAGDLAGATPEVVIEG